MEVWKVRRIPRSGTCHDVTEDEDTHVENAGEGCWWPAPQQLACHAPGGGRGSSGRNRCSGPPCALNCPAPLGGRIGGATRCGVLCGCCGYGGCPGAPGYPGCWGNCPGMPGLGGGTGWPCNFRLQLHHLRPRGPMYWFFKTVGPLQNVKRRRRRRRPPSPPSPAPAPGPASVPHPAPSPPHLSSTSSSFSCRRSLACPSSSSSTTTSPPPPSEVVKRSPNSKVPRPLGRLLANSPASDRIRAKVGPDADDCDWMRSNVSQRKQGLTKVR